MKIRWKKLLENKMTLPHRNHYTEIIVVLHKPSVSFHFTGILVQQ